MQAIQRMVVLAAAAHPDDIEFLMAGTLLLLKQAGADIHMWNLANGSLGTTEYDREDIIRMRWEEAQASAREAGATLHPPLVDDLMLYYETPLIARVAAQIRLIQPQILLLQSPQDYMEDHQNASRLMVTGAFARAMRNYRTDPEVPSWQGDMVLYHAMPHGLKDSLRQTIRPEMCVNIQSVLQKKRAMLARHRSQKNWLDRTQYLNAYLDDMESMCRQVGSVSRQFQYAEGWRRHSHLGFGPEHWDPLGDMLNGFCWVNPAYGT